MDFECDLEEIKKDPKYQAVGQSLELIAAHIEQSAIEIDLKLSLRPLRLPKKSAF